MQCRWGGRREADESTPSSGAAGYGTRRNGAGSTTARCGARRPPPRARSWRTWTTPTAGSRSPSSPPRAGNYTAHVAYAAGYGDAQHTLTVNGGAQVVTYPNTGWETWRQVQADVTLNAGFNTLRLTHRSRWAELDFVEVT
nr:CBM35 domain-containing protein [Micromonospora pallida]